MEEARDAFNREDYDTAFKIAKIYAEQGNAEAEYYMAEITADQAESLKWYQRSAQHGNEDAQYGLGMLYMEGDGVKQDYIEAYKWLYLHGANIRRPDKGSRTFYSPSCYELMETIREEIPSREIKEAESRALKWITDKYSERVSDSVAKDYAENELYADDAPWYKKIKGIGMLRFQTVKEHKRFWLVIIIAIFTAAFVLTPSPQYSNGQIVTTKMMGCVMIISHDCSFIHPKACSYLVRPQKHLSLVHVQEFEFAQLQAQYCSDLN